MVIGEQVEGEKSGLLHPAKIAGFPRKSRGFRNENKMDDRIIAQRSFAIQDGNNVDDCLSG
jgi:hypothetical protein